jgi:hypothetical protein
MFIVFRPSEQRREEEVAELLNRSLTLDETSVNVVGEEYAVIQLGSGPILPPRPPAPRGTPLTVEQWAHFQDEDGRVTDVETVKDIVFRGVSQIYASCPPHLVYLDFFILTEQVEQSAFHHVIFPISPLIMSCSNILIKLGSLSDYVQDGFSLCHPPYYSVCPECSILSGVEVKPSSDVYPMPKCRMCEALFLHLHDMGLRHRAA